MHPHFGVVNSLVSEVVHPPPCLPLALAMEMESFDGDVVIDTDVGADRLSVGGLVPD